MIITITNIRLINGAQMMLWQGTGGFFIAPDTLVFEADDDNEAILAIKLALPDGAVRPATDTEIDMWLDRQEAMVADFARRTTKRAADRRTVGDPSYSPGPIAQVTQRYLERLKVADQQVREGHALPPRLPLTLVSSTPLLAQGTKVMTTKSKGTPEQEAKHFTPQAIAARRWGVQGTISYWHDERGTSYVIDHGDGTTGLYHVDEFEVVN